MGPVSRRELNPHPPALTPHAFDARRRRLAVVTRQTERHAIVHIQRRAAVIDFDDMIGDQSHIPRATGSSGETVAPLHRRRPRPMIV